MACRVAAAAAPTTRSTTPGSAYHSLALPSYPSPTSPISVWDHKSSGSRDAFWLYKHLDDESSFPYSPRVIVDCTAQYCLAPKSLDMALHNLFDRDLVPERVPSCTELEQSLPARLNSWVGRCRPRSYAPGWLYTQVLLEALNGKWPEFLDPGDTAGARRSTSSRPNSKPISNARCPLRVRAMKIYGCTEFNPM